MVTLSVDQSNITLVFNARDLYVTGWRNNVTGEYWRLGAGPERLPQQNGDTHNRNWLNYTDMERAGQVDRGSLAITMGSIQGAVSDLSNPRANDRDRARGLLILVQAFAEGEPVQRRQQLDAEPHEPGSLDRRRALHDDAGDRRPTGRGAAEAGRSPQV